ncbi:uncharacterized protein LOC111249154 [Varroa destructor]|uniref:CUB domain-containing protein n=1 Tax=Varroa destructor TaxID=109461 RepID=A0A7M7JX22_VARDE|nr:uncharacterized protein LOC111249154 [Varroa destructor]XP_022658379.1 uncharacterized protein LOC111249154 [Varroa destructor]XP_022658380.1 uncharacterized protein LOC111249154 [Varroa destructor]
MANLMWRLLLTIALVARLIVAVNDENELYKKSNDMSKYAICTTEENQEIYLPTSNASAYINCQTNSKWQRLNVTVTSQTASKLSIKFNSLLDFASNDTFVVWAQVQNVFKKVHAENIMSRRIDTWMPIGTSSLRIEISNSKRGDVYLEVKQACGNNEILKPGLSSPLVLPSSGELGSLLPVPCIFKVSDPAVYEFRNLTLAQKSSVTFIEAEPKGPFRTKPDHVIIGSTNTIVKFELDVTDPNQDIDLFIILLAGTVCGPKNAITVGNSSVDFPTLLDAKAGPGLGMCVWLLCATGDKKIELSLNKFQREYPTDTLSVLDSGNLAGKLLLQVTTTTAVPSVVVSSGSYLMVILTSMNFQQNSNGVSISASLISSGGHLSGEGNLTFGSKSDYFLSSLSNQSIAVSLAPVQNLSDEKTIEIYTDFTSTTPLVKFDKDHPPFDISSPGSELHVKGTGFTTPERVTFKTIARDSGCVRTSIAAQQANMHLNGDCTATGIWIIRPDVPDSKNTALFVKIWPNNVQFANITHLTDTGGQVSVSQSSDPFMFAYNVLHGAKLIFQANSNFKMSYITANSKAPIEVVASQGSNFTLMSPFFPDVYPMGAMFTYDVRLGDNPADQYLVSFEAMDLSEGDTLVFGSSKDKVQYSGRKLPADQLLSKEKFTNILFESAGTNQRFNPKGSYGFRVNIAPTAPDSQTITDVTAAGKFYTLDKCKDQRCIYIISLPLDNSATKGIAINLTVTVPTQKKLIAGELLVWDGESTLRSPLIAPVANLSQGGYFLSSHRQVIIKYQGSELLNISFTKISCEFETPVDGSNDNGTYTMCKTERNCMLPGWRCNGKADCSDGSDEFYCKGPQPIPHQIGSNGWKAAFGAGLPLAVLFTVLLTKGVPVVLQRFRDRRYQQFHDLGDH